MSRSTYAKWDPPLPETRKWIAHVGPAAHRPSGNYTRALEARFAESARKRAAKEAETKRSREAVTP